MFSIEWPRKWKLLFINHYSSINFLNQFVVVVVVDLKILLRTFSVVLDKISPIHLSKKTIDEDVDLAVEFGKLEEKNYEFTNNVARFNINKQLFFILLLFFFFVSNI